MSDQVTVQDVRIHPQRTLWILMLGAIACALAQTMVVPALPQIQRDFHVDAGATTWLLTAFLLTSSVSTPILGRFGDMYGKERMLLLALALFAVGNLIAALAPSLGVMIAGRMVQGAGGAIFPLAIGIVRDEFPPERVAVSIGSISSTFGIGGGAGMGGTVRFRVTDVDAECAAGISILVSVVLVVMSCYGHRGDSCFIMQGMSPYIAGVLLILLWPLVAGVLVIIRELKKPPPKRGRMKSAIKRWIADEYSG